MSSHLAWLQTSDLREVPIVTACTVGRSPTSQLVLADERVSRRHAVVQAQGEREFWLVDLGSSNGSYVNGRRVVQPVRLKDGDRIEIGPFRLTFRQPGAGEVHRADTVGASRTLLEFKSAPCWLLVADIEGWTRLAQQLPAEKLPVVTGYWFLQCRQIIEANDGVIKKYLGDGFLAYWPATDAVPAPLLKALAELRKLQDQAQPRFRVVLHQGKVGISGVTAPGEEGLFGSDLNYVFRMEKLASRLGELRLMSAAAHGHLQPLLQVRDAGLHALPGFEGEHAFFGF